MPSCQNTSGTRRRLRNISTPSMTNFLDPNIKCQFFFTEFHFLPDGVEHFTQKFGNMLRENELDLPEVIYEWIDLSHAWKVQCIFADAPVVAQLFQVAITEFIKNEAHLHRAGDFESDDESWDGIDEAFNLEERLKSTKIQRLATWELDNLNSSNTILKDVDSAEAGTAMLISPPISSHAKKFDILEYNETWFSVNHEDDLSEVITDSILNELRQLTGCCFITNFAEGQIQVSGTSEESCHGAILKLDNIQKYYVTKGYTNHLFYSESDENVRFALRFFQDISKRYFETTILDNLHIIIYKGVSDFDNLFQAVRFRCVPYNESKSLSIPIREDQSASTQRSQPIKATEQDLGLKIWVGFKYRARGRPDECPAPLHHYPAIAFNAPLVTHQGVPAHQRSSGVNSMWQNESDIRLWAKKISQITTPLVPTPIERSDFNCPGQRQGLMKIQEAQDPINKLLRPEWDTYTEWDDRTLSEGKFSQTVNIPPLQTSSLLANNLASWRRVFPVENPTPPNNPSVSHRQTVVSPTFEPLQPNGPSIIQELKSPACGRSALSSAAPQLEPVPLLPLPKPLTPSLSTNSAPFDQASSKQEDCIIDLLNTGTIQPSFLNNDEFTESFDFPVLEPIKIWEKRYRSRDEVSVQNCHQTMNQKILELKPTPFVDKSETPHWSCASSKTLPTTAIPAVLSQHSSDPIPSFVEDIDQAFKDIVETLRGFRGKVEVQVDFGRIILRHFNDNQLSEGNNKENSIYDATKIHQILSKPSGHGPICHFTPVLTTVSGEVPHFLTMKDRFGNLMWEEKVADWNVTYEFTFNDRKALSEKYFTVEVDAQTFITRITRKFDLGNIYVHGTKRHNDFRIRATGDNRSRTLDDKYSAIATAVETTLWVPSNSTTPSIYWVLDKELAQRFDLQDLAVRRECCFDSKEASAVLKIIEVQSLDVEDAWKSDGLSCIFWGMSGPKDRKPYEKLSSWHEVSIASAQATKAFEENKSLKLGEEAAWTADSISSAAWDMCSPACEMLKQMDDIGWNNENGVPLEDANIKGQPKQPVLVQGPIEPFW